MFWVCWRIITPALIYPDRNIHFASISPSLSNTDCLSRRPDPLNSSCCHHWFHFRLGKQDTPRHLSEDLDRKKKKHLPWLFSELKLFVISVTSSDGFNWGSILIQKKKSNSSIFDTWNRADCLAYFKTCQIRWASVLDQFLHKMYCKKQVKGKMSTNFFIKFKRQMHRIAVGILTPCRI